MFRMDAHARSLLERLNTTSSPKPLKSPTSETKRIATPVSMDNIPTAGSGHKTPISAQNQRPTHATLEEPEATMSVQDLLVSARHRSRETSLAPSSHSTEDTHPTETNSADTVIQDSSRLHPLSAKGGSNIVLHTSDGDSSAKEELPTTPGGSNNSSTVSSSAEKSCDHSVDVHLNPPQGHRVINNVPSIVTLSPMKPNVPRLQITTDSAGRSLPGEGIEQIANLARTFSLHDRDIIGATTKYIVYALKDGRIRIIDQNTGTRAIAETPSSASVISLTVQDGFDSEESLLLVLDLDHELTIWSIKPWKVDSADVPLDYLIRIQTAGRKVDQSFTPIAKWWPRYANCLAVCTGLAVRIYVLADAQFGQRMDISTGKEAAISIPIDTGVRDFCFSSDGSALAVVDYHGDILLWALRSDPTFNEFYLNSHLKTKLTLSKPTITYVLPVDLNPCSIQFLDLGDEISNTQFTPLLLVGSSYNRRLHLVDIGQGMVLQEIVLPSIRSENMPAQNFSMAYTKEKRFLTLGDTLSNSIFFFHLSSLPLKGGPSTSQSEYLDNIVDRKIVDNNPNETFAAFDYITELPFFPHHQLQTLAVTTSMDAFLDVFTAHSNGFTMLSPNVEDILPENYLDAKLTPVKAIPHPELEKAVEPACSPLPRSLSRRSSVESVRSVRAKSPPVVKNEHREDLREAVRSEDHTQLERDRQTSRSPEIGSEDVPSSAKVSEKSGSSSPHVRLPLEQTTHEAVSSTRDLELFLSQALEQQFQRLVTEQKNLTTVADDRHESILKVVSSTLTTNVGKLLEQTVRATIEKSILPTINTTVKKSIDAQLSKTLPVQLEKSIPKELRSAVNDAVQKALFDNDGGVKFSDTICKAVVANLETTLQKDISSRLDTIVEKGFAPLVTKLEERLQASIDKSIQRIHRESHAFQQETAKKLEALTEAVNDITEYMRNDISKTAVQPKGPASNLSQLASRRQAMADQFKSGKYSSGIEIWSDLTDGEQSALFEVCLEYNPSIMNNVEQLTLMSAANAISVDFGTHLEKRLLWLEKILSLTRREGRYTEYWPRVLGLLDQRLDNAFEEISSKDRKDPAARKIAVTQYYVHNKLKEMKE